jgi:hypothetical protein
LTNLGAAASGANADITSLAGNANWSIPDNGDAVFNSITLTSPLSIANGGTGATDAAGALTNLGAAASGANADITSLAGNANWSIPDNGDAVFNSITLTSGNVTVQPGYGIDASGSGLFNVGNTYATTVNIGNTAATTINIGYGGTLTRTIRIGTGTGVDTISIGGGGTNADVISIGDALAAVGITGATTINTTGTDNTDIGNTGYITLKGTGITITGNTSVSGGTITLPFSQNGGVLYTDGSGVLAQTTAGTAGVLHGGAGVTPSFSLIDNTDLNSGVFGAIIGLGAQSQDLDMNNHNITNVDNADFNNIVVTTSLQIGSNGTPIKAHYSGSGTAGEGGSSIDNDDSKSYTITVTGILLADAANYTVVASPTTALEDGLSAIAYVSNDDEVTIKISNGKSIPVVSANRTWRVDVWEH